MGRATLVVATLLGLAEGMILVQEHGHGVVRTRYHGRSLAEWLAALGDTNAGVRDTAAYAIARLVPASPRALPGVVQAEVRMLADADSDVRQDATMALISIGQRSTLAVPAVAEVLARSPVTRARVHAAQVLGGLGPGAAAAMPAVIVALGDSSATVRLVAIGALAHMGVPAGQLGAIVRVAADSDAAVRSAAIEALVTLNAPAETLLGLGERAARDPDPLVRVHSAYALASTGQPARVLPGLLLALADSSPTVRGAAATALGRLGPAASAAAADLERLTLDTDREVREVAVRALHAVRPAVRASRLR